MARAAKEKPKKSSLYMPMATAVWLIDNTTLTFAQIAVFTNMTVVEIEALANGDIGKGLVGRNPIDNHELTADEIKRCEDNTQAFLKQSRSELPTVKARAKGPRYTPVSKRGDKPDAVAFLLKNNPDMKDSQICRLIGTTKPTINAIRDRTHVNTQTIRPRHPAELGLCTWAEYEKASNKALKAAGKDPEAVKKQQQEQQQAAAQPEESSSQKTTAFDFSNFLAGSAALKKQTEE